jgi:hypothetical protein
MKKYLKPRHLTWVPIPESMAVGTNPQLMCARVAFAATTLAIGALSGGREVG